MLSYWDVIAKPLLVFLQALVLGLSKEGGGKTKENGSRDAAAARHLRRWMDDFIQRRKFLKSGVVQDENENASSQCFPRFWLRRADPWCLVFGVWCSVLSNFPLGYPSGCGTFHLCSVPMIEPIRILPECLIISSCQMLANWTADLRPINTAVEISHQAPCGQDPV